MTELREVGLRYSPMVSEALRICFSAHKDQVDFSGVPYAFHPFHLAEQMETEDEICVALLHDVVEDTDWTLEDLRAAGFNECVLEAVGLMTHDPKVPYMDYVAALKSNPIARKVKRADLRHNSDLERYALQTEHDRRRYEKYQRAIALLDEEL